jgi:uncharacterized protein (DUF3820 family)
MTSTQNNHDSGTSGLHRRDEASGEQLPAGSMLTSEGGREYLLQLVCARMPYGRYKNVLLVDLPETYIMWFARKGFPKGKLGGMLQSLYEIKLNGLESLLEPIRRLVKNGT